MGEFTRITLDIETIPDQRPGAEEAARARVTVPKNYKDEAKIKAYVDERAEEAWRKTSLDGGHGELFCIGYALDDGPATVLYRDLDKGPEGERDLLQALWSMLDDDLAIGATWIGHNVQRFDLRFLWQRSVIHQVPMRHRLPFDKSPWSGEVADTMMMWTGERNAFISLDDLLSILGIRSLDPIHGSEVWDTICAGDTKRVIEHCARNVEETREAWRRMTMPPRL